MAIISMTGFARHEHSDDRGSWLWEVRSVNSRGLDLRIKLPPGLDRLEQPARAAAKARFTRGAVSLNLGLNRKSGETELRVNRPLLDQLIRLQADLGDAVDQSPLRLDGLLAVRGVIEIAEDEDDEDAVAAREAALLESLGAALDGLAAMRAEEGGRLAAIVAEHLDEIADLSCQAADTAALQGDAIKARLAEQVAALLEAEPALPEDRLVHEAALIAAKADIREELDRLRAHVAAAKDLLSADEAVGRRLDFLCQELNREANTLCSKSADLDLTNIGLALKAGIERLREQVQNIE